MTTEVLHEDGKRGTQSLGELMQAMGRAARAASLVLARAPTEQKNLALRGAADALIRRCPEILAANERDLRAAQLGGAKASILDRLRLDDVRVADMARGVEEVARLPDPIGTVLARWSRPNGLDIQRVRVPL